MEKMSKKALLLSAAIAGVVAAVVNLLVEYWLNHELVAADYIASATVAVLTALAIFVLFRNRSGKSCG
jgi:surface polysaccharide O-acyltransferase-like enzyme